MQFGINEVRAWQSKVDSEFDDVQRLLNEVTNEMTKDPVEDDPFLKAIVEIGEAEKDAWTKLSQVFSQVRDAVEEMYNKAQKAINDVLEFANDVKNKISL